MTIVRTLGAACAVAALLGMTGAANAGGSGGGGYTRTYGKDKVEIYISVKSGAYADVDYYKNRGEPRPVFQLNGIYGQKPQIKEETAKAWGEVKKVKIEAQGTTYGTWDAGYNSSASTHSTSQSSSGNSGGASVASKTGGGGGGCGCSSSSTTSASASGGTSGSWSTGGGGSSGGGNSED